MNTPNLLAKIKRFSEADRLLLLRLSDTLQYIADISDGDIFIDCRDDCGNVVVLSEASPKWSMSAYTKSVIGEIVERDNEPAVFHSLELNTPIRDLKAQTQENKSVKQDVVPVNNAEGDVIAVLIKEKDITKRVTLQKKYDELVSGEQDDGSLDNTASREINHRIKNNLQVIASMMRLDAQSAKTKEEKLFYEKSIQRILCISKIHDALSISTDVKSVDILRILKSVCNGISDIFADEKFFNLTVSGDDVTVCADKATAIVTIVNELVFNAIKYAFPTQNDNVISVTVGKGNAYFTVTVEDNGKGFDILEKGRGIGLKIVEQTAAKKLNSSARIMSSNKGTKIALDILLDSVI